MTIIDEKKVEISSTIKIDKILIPRIILNNNIFLEGDTIGINLSKDNEILLTKYNPSLEYLYVTKLSAMNAINIQPEALKSLHLNAGDAIIFETFGNGYILIRKIDKKNSMSYSNPEYDSDKMPIPPGWLTQAFVGHPNVEQFLNSGYQTAERISELVLKTSLDMSNFNSILDFGCGCGRVLRGLPKYTNAKLIGCDLHTDAIDWNKKNYNMAEFFYGTEKPPLSIKNEQVDFLYAISVLTHLNESVQNSWLSEWKRILRPGGIVIATFRGEDFIEKFVKPSNQNYAENIYHDWENNNGFCYIKHREWEGVFEDFYSDAYHTKEYINKHWGKYFEIVEIINAGEFERSNRQNVAIMRKRLE